MVLENVALHLVETNLIIRILEVVDLLNNAPSQPGSVIWLDTTVA